MAEACCFGVPDAKYGEEVHAAVVLRGEATALDLQAFCRELLADFPELTHEDVRACLAYAANQLPGSAA